MFQPNNTDDVYHSSHYKSRPVLFWQWTATIRTMVPLEEDFKDNPENLNVF